MKIIAEQIFFGAIIELVSLLLSYIFKDKPRIAIVIFAIGTLTAGFIAFSSSPQQRQPESSREETPQTTDALSPTAVITSTVYDNFNNSTFDGKWNTGLWLSYGTPSTTVEQKDGIITFTRKNQDEGGLTANQTWRIDELRFIEAKVLLDSATEASVGSVGIQITTDINGTTWWLGCSIFDNGNANITEAHCGSMDNFNSQRVELPLNTWHTIRIETDSDMAKMTFFIDDSQIDTYVYADPEEFKKSFFHLYIGVWSQNGGLVTGSIDDIQIGGR